MSDEFSWPLVRLKDVTTDVPNVDPSRLPDQLFTYVDISAIDNERCVIASPKRLLGKQAPSRARRPIKDGDILFSNVRTYLRNVAQVEAVDEPAVASTGFTVLRPNGKLTSRFLYHLARSDYFIDQVTPEQTGTHYPATSDRVVRDRFIPLPPRETQEQLSRLIDDLENARQSAQAHLGAAHSTIEYFRQAVLAAACSGRLTADWREENPEKANARPNIKDVPTARKRRRSNEQPVDLDLLDLPDSYVVATVGAAAETLEYGTSKRCDAQPNQGVPVLRMGNIQDGVLSLDDLKYCRSDKEIDRLMLRDGDLLFNRTNSPELVGKSAVFHGEERMSFASYLIRVRLDLKIALPEFVNYWINSAWGREWARLAKTDGVSQSNINGSKLALMPLPLPPIEEQRVIVARASQMLSAASRLLAQIDRAARDVERSSQAVLAKAFQGELLPAAHKNGYLMRGNL